MNLDNIVLYLQLLLCVRAKRIKLIQSKTEPGIAIIKNVQLHSENTICLKMNTYQFHQLHNQQIYPFQTNFFCSVLQYLFYSWGFQKFAVVVVVVVVVGSRDHRLNPSPSTWTGLDWTGTRAWQWNFLIWSNMIRFIFFQIWKVCGGGGGGGGGGGQ